MLTKFLRAAEKHLSKDGIVIISNKSVSPYSWWCLEALPQWAAPQSTWRLLAPPVPWQRTEFPALHRPRQVDRDQGVKAGDALLFLFGLSTRTLEPWMGEGKEATTDRRCELCGVSMNRAADRQAHEASKMHRKRIDIETNWQQALDRLNLDGESDGFAPKRQRQCKDTEKATTGAQCDEQKMISGDSCGKGDRIHAHFARFGEVQNVEIKRQPDGSSRGFAFIRFASVESVDRAIEAHARHMIDNKWVDVKRHDSDAHAAGPASMLRHDRKNEDRRDEKKDRSDRDRKRKPEVEVEGPNEDRKAAQSLLEKSMKTAMGQMSEEKGPQESKPNSVNPAMMMGMMNMMRPMMMAAMSNPMMAMNMMGKGKSEGHTDADSEPGDHGGSSCVP
eukprot:s931_g1.t2